MKIAVVGAGPAGLVTLHILQKRLLAKQNLQSPIEIVAFEGSSTIGGEWVLHGNEPDPAKDLGYCLYGSMYEGLQTNNSRPVMELHPDFPWLEGEASFPMREDFLRHLQQFGEKFNLKKFINFNTLVTLVEKHGEQFRVSLKNTETKQECSEMFDYVFMCGGQHRKPFIPNEPNLANFTGEVLHYHDMKDSSRFYGKRVLVVGSSFGSMDMAIHLGQRASILYVSWHQSQPFWRANQQTIELVKLKPTIGQAAGNVVTFTDGSEAEVDAIIFATGFNQSHPLAPELNLDFNKSKIMFPLYKHTVHPNEPNLFFIGKSYVYALPLMRYQAEYGVAVIDGRVKLPPPQTMLQDIEQFQQHWTAEFGKFVDITQYFPLLHLEEALANSIVKEVPECDRFPQYLVGLFYALFRLIQRVGIFEYRRSKLADNYRDMRNADVDVYFKAISD